MIKTKGNYINLGSLTEPARKAEPETISVQFMIYRILILLILLQFGFLKAQNQRQIDISPQVDMVGNIIGDTSVSFIYYTKFLAQHRLKNLSNEVDTFHFRFRRYGQLVDISTVDYKRFNGYILNCATRLGWHDIDILKMRFSKKVKIDTALARLAYNKIIRDSILNIPPMERIGWQSGCDGESYDFEFSTVKKYSYRHYWSPEAFSNSFNEAKKIANFIKEFEKLLDLNEIHEYFFNRLPYGKYAAGYGVILNYRKIRKQLNKEDKPKR